MNIVNMRDREPWKIEDVRKPRWLRGNTLHIQAASRIMGRILSGRDGGRTCPAGNSKDQGPGARKG